MLVLTRKPNQSIMIGDDIEVSVLSVVGEKVRIGIHAPHDIPVFRTEIYVEIQREGEPGGPPGGPSSDDVARTEVDNALDKLGDASAEQRSAE
jgi:carbon storage regulator